MNPLTEWFKSFGNDPGYPSDAAATDAYFEAASQAPLNYVATPTSTARTRPRARVISRQVTLSPGVPQMLFPADPNRLSVDVLPGIRYGTVIATNYMSNPALRTNDLSWSFDPGDGVTSFAARTDVFSSPLGFQWIYRVLWSGSSTIPGGIVVYPSGQRIQLPVNTFFFGALTSVNGATFRLIVEEWDSVSGGVLLNTFVSSTKFSNMVDDYVPNSVSFASAGTSFYSFKIFLVAAPLANRQIRSSAIYLSTVDQYFDGSSSVNTRWTGVANASTSELLTGNADVRPYRIASELTDLSGVALVEGRWQNNYHTGAVWLVSDNAMTISGSVTTM